MTIQSKSTSTEKRTFEVLIKSLNLLLELKKKIYLDTENGQMGLIEKKRRMIQSNRLKLIFTLYLLVCGDDESSDYFILIYFNRQHRTE